MSKSTSPKKTDGVAPATSEHQVVEQFRKRAEEFNRLYMSTPDKAKETLHRSGILTKSGKLAKPYR